VLPLGCYWSSGPAFVSDTSPKETAVMAVRKLDASSTGVRKNVALKSDSTRIDPLKLKLGKLAVRHDPRTLMLASYVTAALPTPPASFDLTSKVPSWGMMDNDQIGDCTCAAAGHLIMEWTANAKGKMARPIDKQIVAAYSAITGYNPATGANDNGAVELDVLNYWRQSGIGGHKIRSYMALEPSNHMHIMDSVYIFGGCYIGLQLPRSAQAQVREHQPWSVPPQGKTGDGAPGSWGGHAVPVVAYDARGVTVITWGAPQIMTWSFWEAYCEEAYAILSPDFLTAKNANPQGFNLQQLLTDLQGLQ
jgi:hypothetical protein